MHVEICLCLPLFSICFDFKFCNNLLYIFKMLNANSSELEECKQDQNIAEAKDSTKDFATPEKQEARAFLRERFLRVITGIIGKPAKFHMYENTTVDAEFRGCDVDFLELYVRNMTSPLGVIPEAILRTSDVIRMEIDKV